MAQVSSSPQAASLLSGQPLRVVLFGMPDAGKSSLLGALAQAAQTQEHLLNGSLIDKSQRLLELQRRLYEDRPRETLEEISPYEVSLQPFSGKAGQAAAATVNATLIDCDGRVANELLAKKDLADNGSDRVLTRAVLNADTLVLVVDASTDVAVLKRDFALFANFLRTLERNRGQRTEIGGLPVYLVLTKCDLLAKTADTVVTWMDRIEERKRQVARGFQEFLARQAEREQQPFGKIELHLWATAVKRPALADMPAKPRDPYGVAELFRQCLESAAAYRERCSRATRQLAVAVLGILGVIAVMVLLMLVLVLSQPSQEATALNDEVRRFLNANDKPADRLRDAGDKLKQLQKFKESSDFKRLPEDYQEQVNNQLKELTEYQQFAGKVREIGDTFSNDLNRVPDDAEDQLEVIKKKLEDWKVPPEYLASWAGSPAVQDRAQWLADLKALDREKKLIVQEYRRLLQEGRETLQKGRARFKNEGIIRVDDLDKVESLKTQGKKLMERRTTRANELIPNATEVKNALLFRLRTVQEAQQQWEVSDVRRNLDNYLNYIKGK